MGDSGGLRSSVGFLRFSHASSYKSQQSWLHSYLLTILSEMGHWDELAIGDANYPYGHQG